MSDLDGKLMDNFTLRKPKGWGGKFMAERRAAEGRRGEGQGAADESEVEV